MNQDRILVALCAAFICSFLAEFIANFTALVVVALYLSVPVLLLLACYWWLQQCAKNRRPTSLESTARKTPQ